MTTYLPLNSYHGIEKSRVESTLDVLSLPVRVVLGGRDRHVSKALPQGHNIVARVVILFAVAIGVYFIPMITAGILAFSTGCLLLKMAIYKKYVEEQNEENESLDDQKVKMVVEKMGGSDFDCAQFAADIPLSQAELIKIARIAIKKNYTYTFSAVVKRIESEETRFEFAKEFIETERYFHWESFNIQDPERKSALIMQLLSLNLFLDRETIPDYEQYFPKKIRETVPESYVKHYAAIHYYFEKAKLNPNLRDKLVALRSPQARQAAIRLLERYRNNKNFSVDEQPVSIAVAALTAEGITLERTARDRRCNELQQVTLTTTLELLKRKVSKEILVSITFLLNKLHHTTEKLEALKIVAAILAMKNEETLTTIDTLQSLRKKLAEAFEKKSGIKTTSDRFLETFGKFRDPNAIFILLGSILSSYAKTTKRKHLEDYKTFVNEILNGTFLKNRYENSPHLEELWRENLKEKWMAGAKQEVVINGIKYQLADTDDPCDITLMGSETGTCMSVNQLGKCNVLGNLLDGKYRLITLKQNSEMIVGKAIITLLNHKGKPALFLQPIYPGSLCDEAQEAMIEFAKTRARDLNLDLFTIDKELGTPTTETLESKGSRAHYSTVDAFGQGGGSKKNGIFSLQNVNQIQL